MIHSVNVIQGILGLIGIGILIYVLIKDNREERNEKHRRPAQSEEDFD